MSQLDRLLAEISRLSDEFTAVREEAYADDGEIDAREQAQLDRISANIDRLVTRAQALSGDGHPQVVEFDDDEAAVIESEVIEGGTNVPFDASRRPFKNAISTWRNHCKLEVETLVSSMLDAESTGPEVPRGDMISLLTTVLALPSVALPQAALVIGTLNTLYNLAKNAYDRSLPRQPSLRQAQDSWGAAFDAMTDSAIETGFDELVTAFKSANGYPADMRYILPQQQQTWFDLIDQCSEDGALPRASTVRQNFMSQVIRNMPDSGLDMDLSVGTVRMLFDFDEDRNTFAFNAGEIDDASPEVLRGLRNDSDLYGGKVINMPFPIECELQMAGMSLGRRAICIAHRYAPRSGDTNFRIEQRALSAVDLDRQTEIYDAFIASRAWDMAISRLL